MNSRERKMVMVFGVMLVLLVIYYALYRPIQIRMNELRESIAVLEEEADRLEVEYIKLPLYESRIASSKEWIKEVELKYPAGLSQEAGFELLFAIEDTFEEADFQTVSFSIPEILHYSTEVYDETTLLGTRQTLSSSLLVSYDEMKGILAFINGYKGRTVLSDLALKLEEEEEKIEMRLNMNMYAIEGKDRVYTPPVFDDVPVGKNQVFDSPELNLDYNPDVVERPSDSSGDLFITLKPTQSDNDAQIMGLVSDNNQSTYVRTDENGIVQGILTINDVGGQFEASYSLGGSTKASIGFDPGNALELDLYSSQRVGEDDAAALMLTVVNNTDMTLYVNRLEEDQTDPRLDVNISKGKVVLD